MVGTVGRILGEAGINIAGMQVARAAAGGEALVALTVDATIPAARAHRDRRRDRRDLGPRGRPDGLTTRRIRGSATGSSQVAVPSRTNESAASRSHGVRRSRVSGTAGRSPDARPPHRPVTRAPGAVAVDPCGPGAGHSTGDVLEMSFVAVAQ